jgi:hypothetical protein
MTQNKTPWVIAIVSRTRSLSTLNLPRVLARREYGKQLGETRFVDVSQMGVSVWIDPVRMLSSQGVANLHSKFLVGMDFP